MNYGKYIDFDARDADAQRDAKATLMRLQAFIEEAFNNADLDQLIAHYLIGADLRAPIVRLISDYADHCIEHALRQNEKADDCATTTEALDALEALYRKD